MKYKALIPRLSHRLFFLPLVFFALLWAGCDSTEDPPQGELEVQDLVSGTGEEAVAGASLLVNYVGRLEDGTVFDTSEGRLTPVAFTLGVGQVIEGWDVGLQGMRVGGQRRLIIPPNLAFGSRGVEGSVPSNATVTFEITLEAIINEVIIEDQVIGDGTALENGMEAVVDYIGLLNPEGDVFDASEFRGAPFRFIVGNGEVIEGWDVGVLGMQVGGRRLLIIPPNQAYGQFGFPGSVPPWAVLTFRIDLLEAN